MESVFALIAGLTIQETALVDIDHRVKLLKTASHELFQALLFAITGLGSGLRGGAVINAKKIIEDAKHARSWEEGVLEGLQQIEGAWPYIRANINLMQDSCTSALNQANSARRLTRSLIPQLQAAQTSGHYNSIDRVSLTAFNSDMAQVDARIVSLGCIVNDMMHDMSDTLEIFSALRDISQKGRSVLSESVIRSVDTLLMNGGSVANLVEEIVLILRKAGGAPLIHPEVLGFHAMGGKVGSATSNLFKLKETMKHEKFERR
jgi:hypothetical protein